MRKRERIALPLPRHFHHPIDALYFFYTGVWGGPPRAPGGRGVGNGNDPKARTIDFIDAFDRGTRRDQIGTFDEVVGRSEVNPLCAFRILRHECDVALTARHCIGYLTGVVVDLYCQRQLQGSGKTADQIDRNPP